MDDYSPQAMNVVLSLAQQSDCIQVAIVNDAVVDPNEVFNVVLTTNANVNVARATATVSIDDDDVGKWFE